MLTLFFYLSTTDGATNFFSTRTWGYQSAANAICGRICKKNLRDWCAQSTCRARAREWESACKTPDSSIFIYCGHADSGAAPTAGCRRRGVSRCRRVAYGTWFHHNMHCTRSRTPHHKFLILRLRVACIMCGRWDARCTFDTRAVCSHECERVTRKSRKKRGRSRSEKALINVWFVCAFISTFSNGVRCTASMTCFPTE